jgi:ATP:corrinoid adenosyltransferase
MAESEDGAPAALPRGRTGPVIVNTGDGKGTATAALGVLTRAWGRGMRVVMLQFIKSKTANWGEIRMHVIITGHDAIPELIAYADLVTEMREVKHPYQRGIKAQPGIVF